MSIVVAFVLVASQSAPMPPAKPVCQKSGSVLVDGKREARVHPLGQEPPAKQVLAVVRTFDGCSRPVVVREDIGAPKR